MVSCPACHHSRGSGERLAKIAVMFFWATVKAARRWGCKVGGLGQGVWSPCLESLSIRSLGLLSMCFPQDDDLVNFSPFDFVTQPKKFEIHFICSKKKERNFGRKKGKSTTKDRDSAQPMMILHRHLQRCLTRALKRLARGRTDGKTEPTT